MRLLIKAILLCLLIDICVQCKRQRKIHAQQKIVPLFSPDIDRISERITPSLQARQSNKTCIHMTTGISFLHEYSFSEGHSKVCHSFTK